MLLTTSFAHVVDNHCSHKASRGVSRVTGSRRTSSGSHPFASKESDACRLGPASRECKSRGPFIFHAAHERHASASLHPRQHKLRYDVKSPLAYLERVEKMRLFSLGAHMILTQDSKKRTTAPVAMMRAPSGTKYLGSDMVEALCVATVASEQGHGVC